MELTEMDVYQLSRAASTARYYREELATTIDIKKAWEIYYGMEPAERELFTQKLRDLDYA